MEQSNKIQSRKKALGLIASIIFLSICALQVCFEVSKLLDEWSASDTVDIVSQQRYKGTNNHMAKQL